MPDDTVQFIQDVKKYPCLYNTSTPEYSNRVVTKRAWEEIAKKFNLGEIEVKEKWRKLRIAFARSLKHAMSSGRRSRYYLHDYMAFLIPYLKKHEGIVQIESPVPSEDFEFEMDNSELTNQDMEAKTETYSDSESSVAGAGKNLDPITTKAIYFDDSSFYDKSSISREIREEKHGKRRRIETNVEDSSRKMFLMSLLPEIESFTNEQMRQFRRNIINCIDNIIDDRNKVPKDQKRREDWIKIIRFLRKEEDWLPSRETVICSKHFRDEDKIRPKHDKGRIRLSDKAVPMVIDEIESQMEVNLNIESDEEMVEILESPRKHKMRQIIKRLKFVSTKRLKCIKKLRQKNKRLKLKNKQLSDVIKELKKKRYLTEEEEMQLNVNDEMSILMNAFQNSFKKKRSFKRFPIALRKFALSLNFYSPAAYKYVRASLNNCLPHPRTLLNWYNKINGEPGFTAEAFNVLKIKSDSLKSKIVCNLVLDEMAIRQQKLAAI